MPTTFQERQRMGGGGSNPRQTGGQQQSPGQQQAPQIPPAGGMQQPSGPGYGGANYGLPPTGLQQQLAAMDQQYAAIAQAKLDRGANAMGGGGRYGFDVRRYYAQKGAGEDSGLKTQTMGGSTSLDQLAKNLAQNYGLSIGRGRFVDDEGNFLLTPEQLAEASGGADTIGTAAAKMNYISQAIYRRQKEQQNQKAVSAIQSGLGQVQSRGRGSLAAMQSGMYENLAQLYASNQPELADFSYWIQKEQLDLAAELQRRAEKAQKKAARGAVIGGVVGAVVGLFSGNYAMAIGSAAQAGAAAGQTGWF